MEKTSSDIIEKCPHCGSPKFKGQPCGMWVCPSRAEGVKNVRF